LRVLSIHGETGDVSFAEPAKGSMTVAVSWKPMPISLSTPKNRRRYLR